MKVGFQFLNTEIAANQALQNNWLFTIPLLVISQIIFYFIAIWYTYCLCSCVVHYIIVKKIK